MKLNFRTGNATPDRSRVHIQDWFQRSAAYVEVRLEGQQDATFCLGQKPSAGTRLVCWVICRHRSGLQKRLILQQGVSVDMTLTHGATSFVPGIRHDLTHVLQFRAGCIDSAWTSQV